MNNISQKDIKIMNEVAIEVFGSFFGDYIEQIDKSFKDFPKGGTEMHISAIRSYIVQLEGKTVMIDDLFPGEKVHSVTKINEMPKILRVETLLPIQGQNTSVWVEPVEPDKTEGSIAFTGEAVDNHQLHVDLQTQHLANVQTKTETEPKATKRE